MGSASEPGRGPRERLAVLEMGGPTSESLVTMARDDLAVIGESSLPGSERLEFEAVNIRHSRTGLHCRVQIASAGALLAYDNFNVERDEERRRLSNSAGTRLGDSKRWGNLIRVRFDEFCRRIWDTWLESETPEDVFPVQPQGIDWLIEPFVAKGAGTILYGPPKSCKSWLGMLWAASLQGASVPWRTRTGRVLFVNLERPAHTMRGRLWCLTRAVGDVGNLTTWNRRGSTLAAISPAVMRHIEGVDLVVVDSLSRSGTGDLNANDAANETMDLLNSWGVAWCILAHTPRADDRHVYGSVMQEAAADFLVRVSSVVGSDNLTRGVLLDRQAANDAPPCRPQLWAFDFDEHGFAGVRSPRSGEFPDLEPQAMTNSDRIAEFLLCEGGSSVPDISAGLDLPPGTVRRILNGESRFTRLVFGGSGRGSRSKWGIATSLDEH